MVNNYDINCSILSFNLPSRSYDVDFYLISVSFIVVHTEKGEWASFFLNITNSIEFSSH